MGRKAVWQPTQNLTIKSLTKSEVQDWRNELARILISMALITVAVRTWVATVLEIKQSKQWETQKQVATRSWLDWWINNQSTSSIKSKNWSTKSQLKENKVKFTVVKLAQCKFAHRIRCWKITRTKALCKLDPKIFRQELELLRLWLGSNQQSAFQTITCPLRLLASEQREI